MENIIKEIPFIMNSMNGIIEIKYEINHSIKKSGFNLISGLDFNPEFCLGYPTMHGYVKEYEGTGYACSSAWIQIITNEVYESLDQNKPYKTLKEVDVNENLTKLGIPFFAYGYPADIYDAPCNNLGNNARLKWIAHSFFVTYPSRMNNNTITYIAGFTWGYEEYELNRKRFVEILPLEIVDVSHWKDHLPFLKTNFPKWEYQ